MFNQMTTGSISYSPFLAPEYIVICRGARSTQLVDFLELAQVFEHMQRIELQYIALKVYKSSEGSYINSLDISIKHLLYQANS